MGNKVSLPSKVVEAVSGSAKVGFEELEESLVMEDMDGEKQGDMELTEEVLYVVPPEDCKANEVKERNIVFPVKYEYVDELREGIGANTEGLRITQADKFSSEEKKIKEDAETFLREEGDVVFVNKDRNFLLILTEDEYNNFIEDVRNALDKLETKL